MTLNWHRLLSQLLLWLALEIILNLVGLDDLADYSEFVFAHYPITSINLFADLA